ncbi:MAG: hypothetical protein ACOC9Y_01640 [Chloroflexota bacterium]
MSGRWVEEHKEGRRVSLPVPAGLLVIGAFFTLLILIVIGLVISRGGDDGPLAITIEDLRADPGQYDRRAVRLSGQVTDTYALPLLDQYGLYQFDDGTGSIYVLTDKGIPPGETPVQIEGTFNSAITLDQQLRRLVEEQLGTAAGWVIDQLVPGIPLNVVYLNHERYDPAN